MAVIAAITQLIDDDPFGPAGSAGYDEDALWASDRYTRARRLLLQIVMSAASRANRAPAFVDLGCGTGSDMVTLLNAIPDAVCLGVDRSPFMLKVAECKLQAYGLSDRARLLEADVFTLSPAQTLAELSRLSSAESICGVISSMVLHHYEVGQRSTLYQLARAVVAPQGVFALNDLFSQLSETESARALEAELSDIRRGRALRAERTPSLPTTLSESHYRYANKPPPLSGEQRLLEAAGFTVDVVYREAQIAVLSAAPGQAVGA